MTREEILAMPAGRNMDAAIGRAFPQLVYYWRMHAKCNGLDALGMDQFLNLEDCERACQETEPLKHLGESAAYSPVPDRLFSTEITDAWPIMEMFKGQWAIAWATLYGYGTGWFILDSGEYQSYSRSGPACETAAFAICRAGLLMKIN